MGDIPFVFGLAGQTYRFVLGAAVDDEFHDEHFDVVERIRHDALQLQAGHLFVAHVIRVLF